MASASKAAGPVPPKRYDFASLTPANEAAIANFRSFSDLLRQQPSNTEHHSLFCRLDALPVAGNVQTESTASDRSFSPEATEEVTATAQSENYTYGYYVLSLITDHPPCRPKFGWAMGLGNLEPGTPTGDVDLLLAPSPGIFTRHITFRFDDYGRLQLSARHSGVEMDGETISRGCSRLVSHVKFIKVGPLSYRFEFILSRDQELSFQQEKAEFLKEYGGLKQPLHEVISATPSANDLRVDDWVIHGTVGASIKSVIDAASNKRTLEAVAVKRMRRVDRRSAQRANHEVAIYERLQSIKSHPNSQYVMQMHSVLYQRPEPWYDGIFDEVFLLWTPLAFGTFDGFISGEWPSVTSETKLKLFCQICLGLLAVHEMGWIHRDIKPRNVYVVTFAPPRAVVGDFGSAVRNLDSGYIPQPKTCGTIGWIAPELENADFAPRYNQSVDVWSLGAVGYSVLLNGGQPWMSQQTYNTFLHPTGPAWRAYTKMLKDLATSEPETLKGLLSQMLQPFPSKRTSLRGALANPVLQTAIARLSYDDSAPVGSKRPAP